MAWRIDEQVVKGEIDNRTRGRVIGRLWMHGREEPVTMELMGDPWRDLAGHLLKFTNPEPKAGDLTGFSAFQEGVAGDITASRKVRVPDCSMEELMACYAAKKEFPWHWGNSFYFEWFSSTNGRVVIETTSYQLELDAEPAWTMTEEEEESQRMANQNAMTEFMAKLGLAFSAEPEPDDLFSSTKPAKSAAEEDDEDAPTSTAEALADAEDARMELLLDRVQARMDREGLDEEEYDDIYQEERARLMRERGEKEYEPTPEEIEERQARIEELNAICEEALEEYTSEGWKDDDDERHPLVVECSDLAVSLHHDVDQGNWVPEDSHREHPLIEIVNGVSSASAKLAGALAMSDPDEWPPDPMIAGNVLVRLKKARGYLRDAMRALDSAEEEALADPKWRHHTRLKIIDILAETQDLIREVRKVLQDDEDLGIF